MSFIFHARTTEGYCLKILAELLQYSLKTAYYEIDQTGIRLNMSDTKQHVAFSLALPSENFFSFELLTDRLCFGINQMHMHTMLKTVKKKDTVALYIRSDNPTELGIRIEPKEKTKVSASHIKIHIAHNVLQPEPVGTYTHTLALPSADYAKMAKELAKLSKTVRVASVKGAVRFATATANIYSKEVVFGAQPADGAPLDVEQDFVSEYLANIMKLAGVGATMHVSQAAGLPLMVRANVGTLGRLVILVKTRGQISADEDDVEDILEI